MSMGGLMPMENLMPMEKMMGLLTGRGCDPATLAEEIDKSLARRARMWANDDRSQVAVGHRPSARVRAYSASCSAARSSFQVPPANQSAWIAAGRGGHQVYIMYAAPIYVSSIRSATASTGPKRTRESTKSRPGRVEASRPRSSWSLAVPVKAAPQRRLFRPVRVVRLAV